MDKLSVEKRLPCHNADFVGSNIESNGVIAPYCYLFISTQGTVFAVERLIVLAE